jgi:predicted nucleotidyltransferase component of viral defense system
MMQRQPKDLPASVRQRLLNWSRLEKLDFQFALTRYGIERLLYRLSRSPFRERFVLKGAMLFVAWEGWSPRPTRDVDLLGRGEHSPDQLRSVFEAICRLEVEPDGLVFDPNMVKVTDIREDQAYGGQRVQLRASLGSARIDMQVDVGYGDAVLPSPARINFPTLLDLPAPAILAYPREAVVAEKYHALVTLGMANSRMKDFYDLWALARQFAFEGAALTGALRATFERRRTILPAVSPLALTPVFYDDPTRQALWRAFVNRNRLLIPEQGLSPVASLLRDFLLPPAAAASQSQAFDARWPAGGPWQANDR